MSVQPYADEIIVLDSGSQDKTLEIANRYTDKIYFREFEGHFGQQKNYGLSKCTGKWIFILDSDEFIGENFATTLKYLHSGFKCITMPRYHICSISQWSHFVTKAHYYDWQKRLIKNDSNIFYGNNKVHENLQNYSPRLHCAAGHIFHLDFLLHNYTARAKKSAFYDHLAGGGYPQLYLPENYPYYTMPMQELPEPDILQALRRDKSFREFELRENYFITLRECCKWKVRQAATSLRVALKF